MSEPEPRSISSAATALRDILSVEPLAAIDAFGQVQARHSEFQLAELQNALYELQRAGVAQIDRRLRVRLVDAEALNAAG